MPACASCSHSGRDHNWRVPACTEPHPKDVPCPNCLRQKQLRRVRGSCLVAGCRCDRYVPDTQKTIAANRRIGKLRKGSL
jgi:hypothetical protein